MSHKIVSVWLCLVVLSIIEGSESAPNLSLNLTIRTDPAVVQAGLQTRLECLVDPSSILSRVVEFKWFRNKRFISNSSVLLLPNVDQYSSDNYTCNVKSGMFQNSKSFFMDVAYPPEVFVQFQEREMDPGQNLSVNCDVQANPKAHLIRWIKDDDPNFLYPGSFLNLTAITISSAGRYQCCATNKIDNNNRTTCALFILHVFQEPGPVQISPSKPVVLAGESITLKCEANPTGWAKARYTWTVNSGDVDLPMGPELTISNAQLKDTGKYTCRAFNNRGSREASVYVRVQYSHPSPTVQSATLPPVIKPTLGSSSFAAESDNLLYTLIGIAFFVICIALTSAVALYLYLRRQNSHPAEFTDNDPPQAEEKIYDTLCNIDETMRLALSKPGSSPPKPCKVVLPPAICEQNAKTEVEATIKTETQSQN